MSRRFAKYRNKVDRLERSWDRLRRDQVGQTFAHPDLYTRREQVLLWHEIRTRIRLHRTREPV